MEAAEKTAPLASAAMPAAKPITAIEPFNQTAKGQKMLNLIWVTCGKDHHWCDLENLDLKTVGSENGVYVIWYIDGEPRAVRVGQGDVADRLNDHRNDAVITAYSKSGRLLVTWARVDSDKIDGVERYLGDTLRPLEGPNFPDVKPIEVNPPWYPPGFGLEGFFTKQ